jgi:hypothetical protein
MENNLSWTKEELENLLDSKNLKPFFLIKVTSKDGKVTTQIRKRPVIGEINNFTVLEYDPNYLKETLKWMKGKDPTVFEE